MNGDGQELIVREDIRPILTVKEVVDRVRTVQQIKDAVMQQKVHYGTIPGTDKPSLWQAGAEILNLTFGLTVSCEVLEERITEGEVFYRVRATATDGSGRVRGYRDGVCSSREKKYMWRRPVHIKEWEATDPAMRRITWDKDGTERHQVRQEPHDLIETILGMANKRGYVAVTRAVTGCSDMFAIDWEEGDEPEPEKAPVQQPAPTSDGLAPAPPSDAGPEAVQIAAAKKIKSGESDRGPWNLYLVTDSLGRKYTTFSLSIYAVAQKAMAEKGWVRIVADAPKEGKDPQIVELVGVAA